MPTTTTHPRPPPWRSLDFDAVAPTLSTDVLLATYVNVAREHDRAIERYGLDAWNYEFAALCAARGILAREIADRATVAMRTTARRVAA